MALQTLRQGLKTTEDVSIEWGLLVEWAGIAGAGDMILINLYQKILNWPLLEKILDSNNVLTIIQGWEDKAVQLDNNYQWKMTILGKMHKNRGQMTKNMGRHFFPPK